MRRQTTWLRLKLSIQMRVRMCSSFTCQEWRQAEDIDEAVKAVDYYVKAFPGDIHGEELRWILAERIRFCVSTADRGKQLSGNKLDSSMNNSRPRREDLPRRLMMRWRRIPLHPDRAAPRRTPKPPGRWIESCWRGSGAQTSNVESTGHEVLILNQAQVMVRQERCHG